MAGEVKTPGPGTGATLYYQILGSGTSLWSTSGGTGGWEAFTGANRPEYAVTLTERATDNFYIGNFPAAVPPGVYDVIAYQQLTGSPAAGDIRISTGEVHWNGLKTVPLSDLVTSGLLSQIGPIKLAKSEMVQNFHIYLKSSADHVTPLVSGIVSGQIIRDNGSWGPLQSGAFTEKGNGVYTLQALTSGDLNCKTAMLLFNGVNVSGGPSDPLAMSIVLQRVSGG